MSDYLGEICPACDNEIKAGDAVKVCPSCGIPHHAECWKENHGCTTFGCSEQMSETADTATMQCQKCGAAISEGQMFCPKCGARKAASENIVCKNCGVQLNEGAIFCPSCGQPIEQIREQQHDYSRTVSGSQEFANVNPAISQYNANVAKRKKKLSPILIVGIIIAIPLLIFLVTKLGGNIDTSTTDTKKDITDISITYSTVSVEKGKSASISYDIKPENITAENLEWESSNDKIATVDSNGNVTGVSVGTCTVNVKTDNGLTSSCTVTVTLPKEEKMVVGTWTSCSIMDLSTGSSSSYYTSRLEIKDDNTLNVFVGAGDTEPQTLTWKYSETLESGNYLFFTNNDIAYFTYDVKDYEINLFLEDNDNNRTIVITYR